MTMKKIPFLIAAVLLILAAAAVAVFQFTQVGYLTTVPYRSDFAE